MVVEPSGRKFLTCWCNSCVEFKLQAYDLPYRHLEVIITELIRLQHHNFFNFPGEIIHSVNFSHYPAVKTTRERHLLYIGAKLIHVLPSYFFFSRNFQNSVAFIDLMMWIMASSGKNVKKSYVLQSGLWFKMKT